MVYGHWSMVNSLISNIILVVAVFIICSPCNDTQFEIIERLLLVRLHVQLYMILLQLVITVEYTCKH